MSNKLYIDLEITYEGNSLHDCRKTWDVIRKTVKDDHPYIGVTDLRYEKYCTARTTLRLISEKEQIRQRDTLNGS